MSFFKKILGHTENHKEEKSFEIENLIDSYRKIPWMTATRLENLSVCLYAGFRPATSLPTERETEIRPAIEIAKRLHAIKAIVLWLMVPEENLPDDIILNFVERNQLENYIADDEKRILESPRDDNEARNLIGWKFENAWPLAWYFGYKEPDFTGEMMTGGQMQEIMNEYACPLDEIVEDWMKNRDLISEDELMKKEDLFYCIHNAVRSAQLGGKTVPEGFDPIANGGVIHERRHALTWMLSKGESWDDTDLST